MWIVTLSCIKKLSWCTRCCLNDNTEAMCWCMGHCHIAVQATTHYAMVNHLKALMARKVLRRSVRLNKYFHLSIVYLLAVEFSTGPVYTKYQGSRTLICCFLWCFGPSPWVFSLGLKEQTLGPTIRRNCTAETTTTSSVTYTKICFVIRLAIDIRTVWVTSNKTMPWSWSHLVHPELPGTYWWRQDNVVMPTEISLTRFFCRSQPMVHAIVVGWLSFIVVPWYPINVGHGTMVLCLPVALTLCIGTCTV